MDKVGYTKADEQKAREHKFNTTIWDKEGKLRPIWKTSINDFGEHGVGLMLYFMFLKWMSIGLFIVTILSLPCLIVNCAGNGITDSNKISLLDYTTISNQDNTVS